MKGVGDMPKKLKPEICTSLSGCTPPQDHCRDCSHAIFTAELVARGRKYPLEFNPQHGPDFGKAGKKKVGGWCPGRSHPVWDAFGKWFAKKFASAKSDKPSRPTRKARHASGAALSEPRGWTMIERENG